MAKLLTDTLMMSWFYPAQKKLPSRVKITVFSVKTNTKINRKVMYK